MFVISCVCGVLCAKLHAQDQAARVLFGVVEPPVVAQVDVTVKAPTSTTQDSETKTLECSGLAWVDGHLLISSDRHGHLVFISKVDLATMTMQPPVPVALISNEQMSLDDGESLVLRKQGDRTFGYVMCSMSNDVSALPLPKRRHMVRFNFMDMNAIPSYGHTVINLTPVRDALHQRMIAAGIELYRTFNTELQQNTYRWANTEAMAIVPSSDPAVFLCGMRNPLDRGMAIFYTVSGVDAAFDQRDPKQLKVVDMFTLDLGERGASDMCWDPVTRGYLITAAKSNGPKLDRDQPFPPNSLDSALYWWSGRKTDKPILVARMPDMKIEAVARLGESRYIVVGSDEGDVSESRPGRQSVLTFLDFTGVQK